MLDPDWRPGNAASLGPVEEAGLLVAGAILAMVAELACSTESKRNRRNAAAI
jgi:hypothetical protein